MVMELVSTDGRCRDGTGDDFALRQQALDAGVDQALAELVEIENAADENDEGSQVEEQDAPRQAREDGALPKMRRISVKG